MTTAFAIELVRHALMLTLAIAAPLLLTILVVGLLVGLFQAVTQIQEQTLTFVPKLLAVAGAFLIALPWMLQVMIKYTTELFRSFPTLVS